MNKSCVICGKEFWGVTERQVNEKLKRHYRDKHGEVLKKIEGR